MFLPTLLLALNLTFPVPSLSDCGSLAACKTYCDIPWHQAVCTQYGVDQGLIEKPQVLPAVRVSYPIAELGSCASKAECKTYCNQPENRAACVDFARSHGILTSTQASEGRAPVVRPGGGGGGEGLTGVSFPIAALGNCASAAECKAYCDLPANRQACFNFVHQRGLQQGQSGAEELSGLKFPIAKLGNCGSMAECETYCQQPDHWQRCNAFAKEHGFEPPGDLKGPGGCTSPTECDAYCSQSAHRDECTAALKRICDSRPDFSECQRKHGGPGGCTSDKDCRQYCQQHSDDEDCRRGKEEYCREHPDECKQQAGPGGCQSDEDCRRYCTQHPDDEDCRRGHEEWCREHPDECPPAGEAGRRDEEASHPGPASPGSDGAGPGGCQTEEECRAYCSQPEHQPECQGTAPPR